VVKAVKDKDPDVVLVGSRSHTLIQEAFVGGGAWDIVRGAGRPVLLQKIEPSRRDPEAALESPGTGLPKHVVFPTDFSDTANRARPWLLGLIGDDAPSFSLLHVMPTGSKEKTKSAESQLEELAQDLREHGVTDVSYRVPIGTPYEEILNAGGNRADAFVVMGTHGRGLLPGVVLESVGRQVVRHASARVLLRRKPLSGVGNVETLAAGNLYLSASRLRKHSSASGFASASTLFTLRPWMTSRTASSVILPDLVRGISATSNTT
jgi:nucleotide-binding universal stress UspA family protein